MISQIKVQNEKSFVIKLKFSFESDRQKNCKVIDVDSNNLNLKIRTNEKKKGPPVEPKKSITKRTQSNWEYDWICVGWFDSHFVFKWFFFDGVTLLIPWPSNWTKKENGQKFYWKSHQIVPWRTIDNQRSELVFEFLRFVIRILLELQWNNDLYVLLLLSKASANR